MPSPSAATAFLQIVRDSHQILRNQSGDQIMGAGVRDVLHLARHIHDVIASQDAKPEIIKIENFHLFPLPFNIVLFVLDLVVADPVSDNATGIITPLASDGDDRLASARNHTPLNAANSKDEITMKASYIEQHGGPDIQIYGDLPDPVAGPGEVIVDIHAATVNAADAKVRAGGTYGELDSFPYILGRDFSGVVSALGDGVTDFAVGDAVFRRL